MGERCAEIISALFLICIIFLSGSADSIHTTHIRARALHHKQNKTLHARTCHIVYDAHPLGIGGAVVYPLTHRGWSPTAADPPAVGSQNHAPVYTHTRLLGRPVAAPTASTNSLHHAATAAGEDGCRDMAVSLR